MKQVQQLIFISGLIIYLISNESCKSKSETTSNPISIATEKTIVKTAKVSHNGSTESIDVLGIVTSDKDAKPSFKTGGVISKTFVKEGVYVKKGQLLATLVLREIDAQVQQSYEALSKAERDMNRVKKLFADSVATLEQYQNTTTAYEVAKKQNEIALFNKQYSEVRSPINGTVVKQLMHEGEVVGPGIPVYAIVGTGLQDWKITAGLIDNEWARVKIGDTGTIQLDAFPQQSYNVRVSDKSVIGGQANSTIDISLKFVNPPQGMAVGLIGKLHLTPTQKASMPLTVPIESLTKSNGSHAVVYTIENGKAKKTSIVIGKILGDQVEIVSGLKENQEVITIGAMYVEDGESISISQ